MAYSYDRRPKIASPEARLDNTLRGHKNHQLIGEGFDGNKRFPSMGSAMNAINGVLEPEIELDEVPSAHNFNRDTGVVTFRIAFSNKEDPFSPQSIGNSVLHISYTKLRENAYEVIVYLS